VTDNNGAATTQGVDVQVANRPPSAAFGFSPTAPKSNETITFNSTSTDPEGLPLAAYAWDTDNNGLFDNGTASSAQASFTTPGPHTVMLRVTDASGATDIATVAVDVANRPPVAGFTFSPASPKTLEQVTFTSTSTDSDGTIAAYAWDLDNDGLFNDGAAASAARSFPVANPYTVKLRVTDSNGATDTITKTVTAVNQAPKAAFTTSPGAPTTDGPVSFTSASTDPEGLPLTTSWDLDNNGTFESNGATAQKLYTAPGSYDFKLKVVDASGISDVAIGTIVIPNRLPTALVDHAPKNPQTGQNVTFTATYADPEKRIKAVSWDADNDGNFNDGTTATLTKSFKKPGGYTVKFKVEDLDGASFVAEDNVAPGNQPPKSAFVALPASPVAGSTFTLVSTAIDPDTPLDKWLWDLNGDGVYGEATGPEVQTSFPTAGSYTVGLEVIDSEDVTDFAVQTISVQAPPAPALAAPALTGGITGLRLLTPFPVVRMAGRISKGGTRLRLFAVDAPQGARVVVTCKGRSCPFRLTARSAGSGDAGNGKVHASSSLRIRQLEKRVLKSGVSITIFVTKPGMIGKYVQFKIRKGRPPVRIDKCLMPSALNKPVECPS
jgi:PKD repeat protein